MVFNFNIGMIWNMLVPFLIRVAKSYVYPYIDYSIREKNDHPVDTRSVVFQI